MARTKKVGITGRFGPRYGRKAKRAVKKIEEEMKRKHICPSCDRPGVKRESRAYGSAGNAVLCSQAEHTSR